MKEADGTSGGENGRRAPVGKQAIAPDTEHGGALRRDERNQARTNGLRRRLRAEQLSVGKELDDALVLRRVGVLVQAVVERLGRSQGLKRKMQRQHQRDGEDLSPPAWKLEALRQHDGTVKQRSGSAASDILASYLQECRLSRRRCDGVSSRLMNTSLSNRTAVKLSFSLLAAALVAAGCVTHRQHAESHAHGPGCGHVAVIHDGHTDYLHDGHLHHVHDGHSDEHRLPVNGTNPATCTPEHKCAAHAAGHTHSAACGHPAVPHGDHTDYIVGSHLHHAHGGHCDDHGRVDAKP
jgi:hypothetical protein